MSVVNPKASVPQSVNAIKDKIVDIEEFIAEFEEQVWDSDLENEAKGLLKKLEEKLDRFETNWENNLQGACKKEEDVEILSKDVQGASRDVAKCKLVLRKWIQKKKGDQAHAGGVGQNATVQSKETHSRIESTFKPSFVLSTTNTLEQFNVWQENFTQYYRTNEKTLSSHDGKYERNFMFTCIDSKLQTALSTDDAVKDETRIMEADGLLAKLKAIFMENYPLFARRYDFNKCRQERGQLFSDWWPKKKMKAQECELETIKPEDIMLMELICGVFDDKLRGEFLKERDPTLAGLVKIATTNEAANNIQKNLNSSSCNKMSNYQAERKNSWQSRSRSQSRPQSQGYRSSDQPGSGSCQHCGRQKTICKGDCKAKNLDCRNCGKRGHIERICKDPRRRDRSQVLNRDNSTTRISVVRNRKIQAYDDNEETPVANMVITTDEGRKFEFGIFPDTGSTQAIIAEDIARDHGMIINTSWRRDIKTASGKPMNCSGGVKFEVEWEGHKTGILALVSNDLSQEILLGWRALQRLEVIPEDFPKPIRCRLTVSGSVSDSSSKKVEDLMKDFSDIFTIDGALKTMKGNPMTIHLKDVPIKPYKIVNARKCPYAFEEKAKAKLDEDEALGIIEKVPIEEDDVSDWCSPAHFVMKPNGDVRSVVDLKELNDYVQRPVHPFPTSRDIVSTVPDGTKWFAVFDCKNGYNQIELDKKSKHLTTFLTEFGRYRYKRAPMGLCSSGDEFCYRTDKALTRIPNVKKLVDDVLIYGRTEEELLETIVVVFEKCREWGITLSERKYQFGEEVKFAGYILNQIGHRPDPEKVAAIRDFPSPKDMTNLKSWMGLVNQFEKYAPDLKQAMAPLQGLLSKKNAYLWLPEHEEAMKKIKDILTGENILKHFDPKLKTTLMTDACRFGLGYVLVQHDEASRPRLITCGSRFLSSAEKNYAVVELECLGIQWAVEKCRLYLLGAEFIVKTDHKPLLGILNGRDLDSIQNGRLQRITSKLLGYTFKVEWVAGKKHEIADALSRAPVFQPEEDDNSDVLVQTIVVSEMDPALKRIVEVAGLDEEYQQVAAALAERKKIRELQRGHPAWMFKKQWNFMGIQDQYGLIVYNGRIVVPEEARKQVLQKLHIQHTGQVKTYQNARQLYFWPNMRNSINQMVESCPQCIRMQPSQTVEKLIHTTATRPMEAISVDLGKQSGDWYLIGADRYSGWPMVTKLLSLATYAITDALEDWFFHYGKPLKIRTDGGPQFRGPFREWCEKNGIIHEQSTPYHHESNGHAEVAVREMKHLLEKTDTNMKKFRSALMEWRNTPRRDDSLSPAQWFLGRRQKTQAIALPSAYERIPDEVLRNHEILRGEAEEQTKKRFDLRSCSRSELTVGTQVVVQHHLTKRWDLAGVIIEVKSNRRSYLVQAENGARYVRNRKFLRPDNSVKIDPPSEYHPKEEVEPVHSPKPILRRSQRQCAKKKTVYFKEKKQRRRS